MTIAMLLSNTIRAATRRESPGDPNEEFDGTS